MLGAQRPFNRLGYMDDTTRCSESELDLPVFTEAVLLTNLFSSGPKQLLVVAAYEGFQVTFAPEVCVHGRAAHACALGAKLCAAGRSTCVPSRLPQGR